MVTIRQHRKDRELNDISSFLADVDKFFQVDSWNIRVEWSIGESAKAIDDSSANGISLSDAEFRAMYQGIVQTIDGEFVAFASGEEQCRLLAVDSSFWEISGNPDFELHMLKKYGAYEEQTGSDHAT